MKTYGAGSCYSHNSETWRLTTRECHRVSENSYAFRRHLCITSPCTCTHGDGRTKPADGEGGRWVGRPPLSSVLPALLGPPCTTFRYRPLVSEVGRLGMQRRWIWCDKRELRSKAVRNQLSLTHTGWPNKNRTFFRVCNSCIWWRRKVIYVSNCSVLYLD